MEVYLLVHDFMYEESYSFVRGVYADEADALRERVTRTASGARSRAYDAHSENCCSVETWEIHQATMLKSSPEATSPSIRLDRPQTSASSRSGDASPGSPVYEQS